MIDSDLVLSESDVILVLLQTHSEHNLPQSGQCKLITQRSHTKASFVSRRRSIVLKTLTRLSDQLFNFCHRPIREVPMQTISGAHWTAARHAGSKFETIEEPVSCRDLFRRFRMHVPFSNLLPFKAFGIYLACNNTLSYTCSQGRMHACYKSSQQTYVYSLDVILLHVCSFRRELYSL